MSETIHTQIAVIGAGPAGMAAALSAAEEGARVTILDEGARGGGQIWRHRRPTDLDPRARRWIERMDHPRIQNLSGVTLVDATPGWLLTGDRRGERLDVRAERVVIATGARERFLPFPGWKQSITPCLLHRHLLHAADMDR